MNTYLECIPCFFRQALFAGRAAADDESTVKEILDRVAGLVPDIPLDSSPPETARLIYRVVREVTGKVDPFESYKEKSIETAKSFYPELKSVVERSEDTLRTSVLVAIAGNVIDPGADQNFDLAREMKGFLSQELAIDDYESFRQRLEAARRVLYLGDNAGETIFDKILIETIAKDVIYAVRGAPIINDATIEDAEKSGLCEVARVVSSGCDAPGTLLKRCSERFVEIFNSADIIISKGQGNYESLAGEKAPIFFLLKVKCPVIAQHIGTETGVMVLKDSRSFTC
ncbi:MAG: ARMT1-like domain-containing protein [Desulfatiglandaceae bacterium]